MSRLPPALARRVDRLARRAHRFHRLAHHPLCERYAGEVFRLGRRTRLCRGCTLAAAGGLAGLVAGLAAPALPAAVALAAGVALAALAPAAIRRRPPAPPAPAADPLAHPAPRLVTRFAPPFVAAALLGAALRRPGAAAAAGALLAATGILAATLRYRRRGPDRAPCVGCAASPPSLGCPGFAPIAVRERALRRLAGRWIDAAARAGPAGDR